MWALWAPKPAGAKSPTPRLETRSSAAHAASPFSLSPCSTIDLKDWAQRAQHEGAIVLLTLRSGERAALGSLQRLLDDNGVPYSGPSASMVEQCADTGAMLD